MPLQDQARRTSAAAQIAHIRKSFLHGSSFIVWMLAEYRSPNLAPIRERSLVRRLFITGEDDLLAQEKRIHQVQDHLRVSLIAGFLVLRWVSIHVRLNHSVTVIFGGEMDHVSAEPSPTAMKEQGVILSVDELFVLHSLRDEAFADALYFLLREVSM